MHTEPVARRKDESEPDDRPARGGRHRRGERSWVDLVDDVVHSSPLAFRVTVLILAIATGSTAAVMALCVAAQLALAALAARGRRERQRRLRALRTGRNLPTK